MKERSPRHWELDLQVLDGPFVVCRLAADAPLPAWADAPGTLVAITRTAEELSVVCPAANAPAGVRQEGPWRALRVAGPLDFTWVGILAALSACLAASGVSLFAISTFDTDYLLVKAEDLPAALSALTGAGHRIL